MLGLPKLALGTGIARLPTRFYTPFLFTFPPQPIKNWIVTDDAVRHRFDKLGGTRAAPPDRPQDEVTDKERALLADIAAQPIAGITARYNRLGWHPTTGNDIKNAIIAKGLATFDDVPTASARIKILTLTDDGIAHLTRDGITVPSWRRGGAAHEYWRETIRQLLERHGYTVTDEYTINGGSVDLHAAKLDHEVIVEIETGKSDIAANSTKCTALPATVVFFFLTGELREAWRDRLPPGVLTFTPVELDRLAAALR